MLEWFVPWGGADEARMFGQLASVQKLTFVDERLPKRQFAEMAGSGLGVHITRDGFDRLASVEPVEGLLGSSEDRSAALSLIDLRLVIADESRQGHRSATIGRLRRLASESDSALASGVAHALMSLAEPVIQGDTDDVPVSDLMRAAEATAAADDLVKQDAWKLGFLALALHERFGSDAADAADAADEMYRRALEADPSHANHMGNYAVFLRRVRGDHDAAEAMYQRALEADPSHTNNLGNYAFLLRRVRGDHDAAEAMYQRALEADPRHTNNLGNYASFLTDVCGAITMRPRRCISGRSKPTRATPTTWATAPAS